MLQWNPLYETGVQLVDTQHKVLFENINKLEELTHEAQIKKAEVDRVLQFLETYAINHFNFEEQCMHRYHCPTHEENKRAHALFLQNFTKLKDEYQLQGPTHYFLKHLYSVASNWIQNHIMRVDVKLKGSVPHS